MRKKSLIRRTVSLSMTAVLATSMLAGCKQKEKDVSKDVAEVTEALGEEGGKDGEDATKEEVAKDPITFSFYSADGTEEDPWTDPVAQEITKATGVSLKLDYPIGDNDEKIALMIASGEYPDIIFAKGGVSSLVDAGALIDMTDLIEQYGPHIKGLYGDYYSHLKYSTEDESIYALCSSGVWGNAYTTSGSCQMQFAVLKANDYKIPKTLAEYEAYIKNYMKENPTIDGQDTIGLTLSCSDWHWYITLANPAGFIADVSPDNGQFIINDANNYQASYKHTTENEKEYYRWLNRMFNEGVLDPEFATQTHDDYIAKVSSGRVLGVLDQDWDIADAVRVLVGDGKDERTYAPLPVTMYEDQKCPMLMQQGPSFGWGVSITTACEDPVRAIQFIDYLCSDEGQVLTNWGIEGQQYFIDEEGHRYRTDEEIELANSDTDYKKRTGVGYHNYPWPAYGNGYEDPTGSTYTTNSKSGVIAAYNKAQKECVDTLGIELLTDYFPQASEFQTPPYSPVWAQNLPQEFNDIQTVLDDIAWSDLIKCVICSEAEFDATWDQLQKDLDDNGREEAEKMLTELLQAQVKLFTN